MPYLPTDYWDELPWAFGDLITPTFHTSRDFESWYNGVYLHYVGAVIVAPYVLPLMDEFQTLGERLIAVRAEMQKVGDFLALLTDGYALDNLHWWYHPTLYDLDHTPTETVGDIIAQLWPDWYWFTQNPGYMVESWLIESYPWFAAFLADPSAWLIEQLDTLWPPFASLRSDTPATLLSLLSLSSPFFAGLDADPEGWFSAKVAALVPEPISPITSPWRWLLKLLTDNVNPTDWSLRASIWSVGEHLLRWMFEGVW